MEEWPCVAVRLWGVGLLKIKAQPVCLFARWSTAASGTATLADGADHAVKWTRARDGEMVVSVDGTEAIRVADAAFRDTWSGLTVINGGGAMTLRTLSVFGTR